MEEVIYNKIYARTNEQNIVTYIFSEAFDKPLPNDICIDSENTERHGANKYQTYDEKGIANYEIRDGMFIKRDKSNDLRQIEIANYPSLADMKIRQKYSVSDELAILRQRDIKPDEYAEYYAYCEKSKSDAKAELKL